MMREDPRIERSRQVILRAALAELGEVGYGAFTIESVAARAGVGKSTIYRHWREKIALIADAFQTFHEEELSDVSTGSPREKLERIVRHVAEIVSDSIFSKCIPALIDGAARAPEVHAFYHRFQAEARQPLIDVIAEGIALGDFRAGIDPALAGVAILGAIFYRRLMTNETFDPDRAAELIETVLGKP